MILERRAVEDILDVDLTDDFDSMFAPDEAYFITLLRIKGFPAEWINNQASTWVEWKKGKRHPTSFSNPEPETLSRLFTSSPFFARKFPAEKPLTEYRLHLPDNEH